MLEINNIKFTEKFTEINIRHRRYEEENYITLLITTEFFPALYKENIVSGALEAKVDIKGIKSLNDLKDKSYKGEIGSLSISVNNNGIWEHEKTNNFEIEIKNIKNRDFNLNLSSTNCSLETTGTLVSLYTTSTSEKVLKENFNLKEFYPNPQVREIGKNKVYKYFVKE